MPRYEKETRNYTRGVTMCPRYCSRGRQLDATRREESYLGLARARAPIGRFSLVRGILPRGQTRAQPRNFDSRSRFFTGQSTLCKRRYSPERNSSRTNFFQTTTKPRRSSSSSSHPALYDFSRSLSLFLPAGGETAERDGGPREWKKTARPGRNVSGPARASCLRALW